MENKGFRIKKYLKENWGLLLTGLLIVAVFGYYALGKAMGIAEPGSILFFCLTAYLIVEGFYFIKYLMRHRK